MKRNVLISTPAKRYAKAFLEVAIKQRNFSTVLEELETFYNTFETAPVLRIMFVNPAVPYEKKKKVLDDLAQKMKLQPLTLNLLRTLLHRGRISILDQVIVSAEQQFLDRQGIIVVEVTTARPLNLVESDGLVKELETFTGKKVQIENAVNPALIGGVVTRIGTTIYDGSVLTQLQQMKAKIIS
jgi:F-type H+-transporting ATPase subunit delta